MHYSAQGMDLEDLIKNLRLEKTVRKVLATDIQGNAIQTQSIKNLESKLTFQCPLAVSNS